MVVVIIVVTLRNRRESRASWLKISCYPGNLRCKVLLCRCVHACRIESGATRIAETNRPYPSLEAHTVSDFIL
jgi:hypothetical protein